MIQKDLGSLRSKANHIESKDLFKLIAQASSKNDLILKNVLPRIKNLSPKKKPKQKPDPKLKSKYEQESEIFEKKYFAFQTFGLYFLEKILKEICKNQKIDLKNLSGLKDSEKKEIFGALLRHPEFKKYIYEKLTYDFSFK